MTFAVLAHRMDRRRTAAVPDQVGIAVVLEHGHAVLLRQPQQFGAAHLAHDGAGGILHGRDGVDVFRPDIAPLKVGERGRERISAHALAVQRHADRVDAEQGEPGQRALKALLLDDDGVAARQEHPVNQIERLQRPRHDQEIVGRACDPCFASELGGEEFAQRPVALRSAGEPVAGQRCPLAPQHGLCRCDQAIDRDLVGVVVAADEVVFRKPLPSHRRRRQSG